MKDFARVLALLEADATDEAAVADLAGSHLLGAEWQRFQTRFLNDD